MLSMRSRGTNWVQIDMTKVYEGTREGERRSIFEERVLESHDRYDYFLHDHSSNI